MTTAFWRRFGEGATRGLAFHCSLAHSGSWRGVSDHLGAGFALEAMDLPSHGQSPVWNAGEDYGEFAVDFAREKLDRPLHLLGHSFGAYVALRLAIDCPDKVLSLSLFEPVFFAAADDLGLVDTDYYRDEMAQIQAFVTGGQSNEGARRFVRSWGDGRRWHALPAAQRAQFAALMPAVLAAQAVILDDAGGYVDRLSDISCPTLLMDGALSHPTMAIVQNAIAAKVQNARRVTLQEVGHMGVITHPELVAKAFAANINSVS